ncbi:MAG: hypothetical protein A3B16_00335 [Candidatus Zambryskibacteria bacterium RIFCSPLOWO2_01_FULL_45_43]|uniref:Transposase IS200-like domain-containing protein n=2 Tax=Candidatus Zambryskiibacteriota TaxID=1817925 RepID=A0A1G2UA84_9BACT|nr:MAG: hypothetical protein A3B16_00335 [Candidatus Zambryskibacteria bacterium RIFCSPLOWO2_01_FULL_45_43]
MLAVVQVRLAQYNEGMRIEPYTTDSIIHVMKRGARGMDIVGGKTDKWYFIKSLFLLNDAYSDRNWHRETAGLPLFKRPDHWPERNSLTRILAWVLMPNHFHLLLQEKSEGGTAKFMQRLCGSMSLCFNLKYKNNGSIFQGAYKAKVVDDDSYLRHLLFYIQVKNVLELYPGGLVAALKNFDKAWEWALKYPFSSLPVYVFGSSSPILGDDQGLISQVHKEALSKQDAYEMLKLYVDKSDTWSDRIKELILE